MTPGQIAFEAYQKLGGQSGLLSSTTIRKFELLTDRQRELWEGIAASIIDAHHLDPNCEVCIVSSNSAYERGLEDGGA